MLALNGFMSIVWFVIEVAFILKDMKEWADISIGEVFTFEANSCDEVVFMISIS